ncbi:hypothetical protein GLAREA_06102 [Glarea lozoyensis ATCC 20868]|uniref:Tat pathway signal sequence n=1 Tax=Glarea lozoyensis (strain ATCC 20868 / MF5171) TaxID=1116229 RepID=S3D5P8_GLAL2|nr:uncharacterized protein GLAREA_06102 [Glarea lozoyensis ATCC 20868]EPE33090.1 hypothetical protein GLAREA_06102 [Glarea lozoyensis ATCC 20868]
MSTKEPIYEEILSGDSFSSVEGHNSSTQRTQVQVLPLTLSSLLSVVLGISCIYFWSHNSCETQYQYSYPTEWCKSHLKFQRPMLNMIAPARSVLGIKRDVIYTSALRYNDTSGEIYRDFDPAAPQYAGDPSPAIDEAWGKLLSGQYLVVPPEIAMKMDDPVPISDTYLAEVEVMHSLHCLNAIRKALNPEYYERHSSHKFPEGLQKMHVIHCIEQLRQTIQCAGDLTPVPLRPYGDADNVQLIGTPMAHTCRDWDVFRRWYSERGAEWGNIGSM